MRTGMAKLALLPDQATDFCRLHRIRKLALFGSVLEERFGPDSDVDVLVEYEPGTTVGFAGLDMEEELSRMLAAAEVQYEAR